MDTERTEFALIQWNTQKDTLFASLAHLRNAQLHTDVLVSCEDSFFPAHRLILTLSSQYFARAFQILPNTGYPVFILCEIPKRIFEAILCYIYEGKVTIVNEDVAYFMKAGLFLEIAGLKSVCKPVPETCNVDVLEDQVSSLSKTANVVTHVKQEIVGDDEFVDVVNLNSPSEQINENVNVASPISVNSLQENCGLEKNLEKRAYTSVNDSNQESCGLEDNINNCPNTSIKNSKGDSCLTKEMSNSSDSSFQNFSRTSCDLDDDKPNYSILSKHQVSNRDKNLNNRGDNAVINSSDECSGLEETRDNNCSDPNSKGSSKESCLEKNLDNRSEYSLKNSNIDHEQIDKNITETFNHAMSPTTDSPSYISNDEKSDRNMPIKDSNLYIMNKDVIPDSSLNQSQINTDESNLSLDNSLSNYNNEEVKTGFINVAKKHTRSCCRCKCCDKMFASKRALNKHYFKMENYNISKKCLRSSKDQCESAKDSSTVKARKTNSRKLLAKHSNEENMITNAATGSPLAKLIYSKNKEKSAAAVVVEYLSPEQISSVSANLLLNSKSQRKNPFDNPSPTKRRKINSKLNVYQSSSSSSSDFNDGLSANIIDCSKSLDDENDLETDNGAPFSISGVYSLKNQSSIENYFKCDPFEDLQVPGMDNPVNAKKSDNDIPDVNCRANFKKSTAKNIKQEMLTDPADEDLGRAEEMESDLNNHRKNVICDICSSEFTSYSSFKKHKQNDCKILECPYCFTAYLPAEKNFLKMHIGIHAIDDCPFTCPECPYRANKSKVMDDHMSIHKGIFRFWCPLCKYKGKTVNDLKMHNKSNHPNMKIFD